jgi:hypothetical protein
MITLVFMSSAYREGYNLNSRHNVEFGSFEKDNVVLVFERTA